MNDALVDVNAVAALLHRVPKTVDRLIKEGAVPAPLYDPRTRRRFWPREQIEALARDLAPRRAGAAQPQNI